MNFFKKKKYLYFVTISIRVLALYIDSSSFKKDNGNLKILCHHGPDLQILISRKIYTIFAHQNEVVLVNDGRHNTQSDFLKFL